MRLPLWIFLALCLLAHTGAAKMNVVFILVDDWGWADAGVQGSDFFETPNIDKFARKSLRFTQAYAAAAICSPTRAAIMTGKFPARLARKTLYWHYPHYYPRMTPGSAMRDGNWKLIHYYEDDRMELFNLSDDPGEAKDLAATQPAQVKDLRAKLDNWRKATDAKAPLPNPDWQPRNK